MKKKRLNKPFLNLLMYILCKFYENDEIVHLLSLTLLIHLKTHPLVLMLSDFYQLAAVFVIYQNIPKSYPQHRL